MHRVQRKSCSPRSKWRCASGLSIGVSACGSAVSSSMGMRSIARHHCGQTAGPRSRRIFPDTRSSASIASAHSRSGSSSSRLASEEIRARTSGGNARKRRRASCSPRGTAVERGEDRHRCELASYPRPSRAKPRRAHHGLLGSRLPARASEQLRLRSLALASLSSCAHGSRAPTPRPRRRSSLATRSHRTTAST